MEIFGSYLKKDRRILGESINVIVLDTAVAVVAGLIIIPVCFLFTAHSAGFWSVAAYYHPPNVFHHMAGSHLGQLFLLPLYVFRCTLQ